VPVIIDGHNLIGKMKGISLADPDDEEKLVRLLAQHLQGSRRKAIVVFDKGSDLDFVPSQKGPKLRVIFAPPESTADALIMDMIKRDPNPRGLTIVSSDNEIRRCARSRRAHLMSSEEFAQELESGPHHHKRRARTYEFEKIDVDEWLEYFKGKRR
jgi:predicted RNA-binding protein with PIN domain